MLTDSTVTTAPDVFAPSNVKNTTTPIPSLNNDSPAILVSVRGDNFIFLIMDRTAIGSVGAISDPNNKQSIYVMPRVDKPNIGALSNRNVKLPTT